MNHSETEAVRSVIQNYITGTYNADIKMLQAVFHPEARMTGYLGDMLLIGSPAPFIQDIGSQPSMKEKGDPYEAEIRLLAVSGAIAEAVVFETGFRGDGSLENHFHLIKDGEWKIISKLFTTL